ncbi:MAG: thioredoxin family protein [Xanthobacteraceae bacterium]|nr:thioredoxin family protein [Xanthobacteraceae bacterium]
MMSHLPLRTSLATLLVAASALLGASSAGLGFDGNTPPAPDAEVRTAGLESNAPDFVGVTGWLNSEPLSIKALRGKVVLVDFWTYGCVNCVHTLPYVTQLYERYKDKGLVVVGVHTPEFPFETSTGNVRAALQRHGIRYPVAQDNASATWNAYGNQYWPAQYIIDRNGRIVFSHAGEGAYDTIERTVQALLNDKG